MCALLAVLAACAGAPPRPTPVHPQAARPRPYPLTETRAFARAVARGTRTRDGRPGPLYWQQRADYRLEATLDPATARLTGRGTVRYYNRSPERLDSVAIQLYQNLYAPTAMRNRVVPITRGIALHRVAAAGRALSQFSAADTTRLPTGRYRIRGTVAWISLRAPVTPGGWVDLEFDWSFNVPPRGSPRMGQDGEVFHIAYWYPQVAVYDDVNGWQVDQYLSTSEFYMGYGNYDVAITVPHGWLVTATGELANPAQVLSPRTRQRLARSMGAATTTSIVGPRERSAGVSTTRSRSRRLTWRYSARNVRDFAWTTSSRYVWDATRAIGGDANGDRRPDTIAINSFYRPGTVAWDRSARYVQHAIEFLSRYLWAYPYPHMTAVEGIIGGGMEFPMLTLVGGSRDSSALQSVIFHETGHVWFPMIVGSDEKRHPWQDEGLTRFNQAQGRTDFFPAIDAESAYVKGYTDWALRGEEVDVMRGGDFYPTASAYRTSTYEKPAAAMIMLRAMIGDIAFTRAYREYGRRWQYRHPQPYDLWNTFSSQSGRNLDWFWRTWFFETWTLDQAIGSVRQSGRDLLVTIEDRGLAPMPVHLTVTRTQGRLEVIDVPVDVWLAGATQHTVRVRNGASVTRLEIDAGKDFADVNRSNQAWTPPPAVAR